MNVNASKWKKLFAILLCLVKQCEGLIQEKCLDCQDFNRINSNKCVRKISDCGQCAPGYSRDEKDDRFCYQTESVESGPEVVLGVEGHPVELPCTLSEEVECYWEKNGHRVSVDDSFRYHFKSRIKGEPKRDCTLVIQRFSPNDVDDWRCCSNNVKAEIIKLEMAKPPKLLVQPKSVMNATHSQPVVLTCAFDQPVQCDWTFRPKQAINFKLEMKENYEYLDETIGVKTDCSIRIKAMGLEEEGQWTCKGLHPPTNSTHRSKPISLTGNHQKMFTNVIAIVLNDVVKTGRRISSGEIMGVDDQLECEVSHVAKEMEWILRGETLKMSIKANSIALNGPEVLKYLENRKWSTATLQCNAMYEDGSTMTSHITIFNTEAEKAIEESKNEEQEVQIILPLFISIILLICLIVVGVAFVLIRQLKKWNKAKSEQSTNLV